MAHGVILGQTPTIDTSTLVTQDSLTNTLNNYVTTSALNNRLNNYATTASLNNYLLKSGGTMTGQLNMSKHKITNLANGTADTDAATIGQLNAAVASNIVAIFGDNEEDSGVVIGPTCLYVWMDSTLNGWTKRFRGDSYTTINKWYNLSGLYSKGITQLDLSTLRGSGPDTIGDVLIGESYFDVHMNTIYCGFAYIQTFNYN